VASIVRPSPPEHILVIDTNILWDKDKGNVVNLAFDQFWDRNSPTFPMKLMIPATVQGELLYQQTTSALKLLEKANESIREIERITGKHYSHRVTKDRVQREIAHRFDEWLQAKDAELWEVPVSQIKWGEVVHNAVWRILPFTPDSKNTENEKGFRDAMILETVEAIYRSYSQDVNVAFVCNDHALRTAAKNRLSGIDNFAAYESLENFQSFIDLTKQNLTQSFVRSILHRAEKKFFDEGDTSGLFYKDDLCLKIMEKFQDKIEHPVSGENLFVDSGPGQPTWVHVGNESIWIRPPVFKELTDENIFHWTSQVTFVRLYAWGVTVSDYIAKGQDRRLMVLSVDVGWKAQVRADGRFFLCEVTGYQKSSYSFKAPTQEQLSEYGIERTGQDKEQRRPTCPTVPPSIPS